MNELLEKYWAGETSLQEEESLRIYFRSEDVAPEHQVYQGLFLGLQPDYSNEVDGYDAFAKVKFQQRQNRLFGRKTWTGIAVAASVSIMVALGSGVYEQPPAEDLGTYESPEEAYEATIAALELVSNKFNKGKNNLKPMTEINKQAGQVFNLNQPN